MCMLRRNLDTDLRESRESDECFCCPDSPQEILLANQTGRCNNLEGAHTGTLSRDTQGHSAGVLEKSPSYHHRGPLGRQKIWLSHSEVRPKQREEGRNLKKKKLRNSSKILQLRLSCSHINFSFLSSLQFLSLPFLHWSPPAARSVVCQVNLKWGEIGNN